MIAADTNILVRLIARDDARQAAIAEALLAERGLFVSAGVLMETEWVLRGLLRWPRARVAEALADIVAADGIEVENPAATRWALTRHAAGADLADMLHLVAARRTAGFVTFDSDLAADAGWGAPVPVETLR